MILIARKGISIYRFHSPVAAYVLDATGVLAGPFQCYSAPVSAVAVVAAKGLDFAVFVVVVAVVVVAAAAAVVVTTATTASAATTTTAGVVVFTAALDIAVARQYFPRFGVYIVVCILLFIVVALMFYLNVSRCIRVRGR